MGSDISLHIRVVSPGYKVTINYLDRSVPATKQISKGDVYISPSGGKVEINVNDVVTSNLVTRLQFTPDKNCIITIDGNSIILGEPIGAISVIGPPVA